MKSKSSTTGFIFFFLIIFSFLAYYFVDAGKDRNNVNEKERIKNIIDSTLKNNILKDSLSINESGDKSEYLAGVYFDSNKKSIPFRILFPENFDTSRLYPIVLFFHGAGERGSDNKQQTINGGRLFLDKENRERFPCIVIFPQCPENERWVIADWTADSNSFTENPAEPMRLAIGLLEKICVSYKIDLSRIYVAGLSMGGFATWDIICRYPNKFAAAIPICGGGDEKMADKIKDVPIWAFHGDKDNVVKVIRTRNMISAIKMAGGNPKYTEYKNVAHGSWIKAFSEPDLLTWMFSRQLNKK